MNKFIKNVILTILLFPIGLVLFVSVVHIFVRKQYDFSLKENYKYLILGHSHPECAFNDNLIDNFKNLSKSGESYFYTYQKVKKILSINRKIEAVFIEYSNNVINKSMDYKWIWGYEKMNAYFPVHSPFMDKKDIIFLYRKNPQDFLKVISTSTRNNLNRIVSLHLHIDKRYGGYNHLVRNKVEELIKEKNTELKETPKEQGIAINNINYLEKIIDYCNDKNVKVFLIRSPQHKFFTRDNENKLYRIRNERFKNIEFLDFDKFPLKDDQFGDFGHLNYKGAKIFSLWFYDLIKDGLLTKKNKNEFIKNEIEKVRTHNKKI